MTKTNLRTRASRLAVGALLIGSMQGCDFIQDIGESDSKSTDLFPVQLEDRWGYVNASGRMVIEPKWSQTYEFSEGLAGVRVSNWSRGYIDASGEFAIEPRFSETKRFSEGLAPVKFDGRWGYIDKSGSFVLNPQYTSASPFSNGRAWIRTSDFEWEYIDKNGTVVRTEETPRFEENDESMFQDGLALVFDEGLGIVAKLVDLPLHQIVKATSWNQAQSLGLENHGKIEAGFTGDIAILSKDFKSTATFVDGEQRF